MAQDPSHSPYDDSSETPTGPTPSASGDVHADLGGSPVKCATDLAADTRVKRRSMERQPQMSQSQPVLPPSGYRRMFSPSKGKRRDQGSGHQASRSQVLGSPPVSPSRKPRGTGGDEDSPFITPTSPLLAPINSSEGSSSFRGFGFKSLHPGTQTLIHALQAVPWAEDQDNDDDILNHDVTPVGEAESDEDDKPLSRLTSSIHAIYKPLSRLRRREPSASGRVAKTPQLPSLSDNDDVVAQDGPVFSDEEGDFESTPIGQFLTHSHGGRSSPDQIPDLDASESEFNTRSRATGRSGSMATVRQQRRAQLADKLRDVFEIQDINEVVAELPCWLLRSVLLQGYIYLTDTYICFFAHMPSKEDQVLKSGSMFKRAQRTKRWIRHWFVLKNDVLSWYQSAADPYFPHGVVDLRYAISCEPVNQKDIRLRTNQKTIRLAADSVPSRDEWVKAIRKVMLRAQNMGNSIKIAIPYRAVVDVERSNAMDFSETIEIKVQDKNVLDSYFFAYFQDLPTAVEQIRDAVRTYRGVSLALDPAIVDTTSARSPVPRTADGTPLPTPQLSKPPAGFRLSSLFKLDALPIARTHSAPAASEPKDEYTHIIKRDDSFVPLTTSSSYAPEGEPSGRPGTQHASTSSLTPASASSHSSDHTYPPSHLPALTASPPTTGTGTWTVGVPSWLKVPARHSFFANAPFSRPHVQHAATMPEQPVAVSEVLSSRASSSSRGHGHTTSGDFGFYSILEAPSTTMEADIVDKFRAAFAFDENEKLLGMFPGHLYRIIPIYGRLYVSENYFCFKSTGALNALNAKTKMILPIKDILAIQRQKSFRFGHQGLVIIIRGHEELFIEFMDEEKCDGFVSILERQMEDLHRRQTSSETPDMSKSHMRLVFDETGRSLSMGESPGEDLSESTPAYMFTSQSSTFLSFKPERSLHFTFLTIGSRGDVQPYIALAKGLLADGHRVRIATHGEFKEWVESHGIEFGYVGGDPAELMRICVENGTFTVAFLKEGVQKFRGWIDDLLKTAWQACQNTDVLVESPSAMAGYHIAEALKIPYFRAFTMTWSRTRAYPHAFAVPEHKMGGNYNYMTYVLFDQVFWRGTAGQINRWRKNVLNLPSTSLDKMEPHKIPFLYNFSPIVVPQPLDWPEWIRVTGYWFLDDADVSSKKWTPPADLLKFIETARLAKKKIVYVGFGSIVVPDPKAMTRCVIDAIVKSDVYAILSKGWSDRLVKDTPASNEPEVPLPSQIYPISSVPHDWLFKQIDAACHHGGAGTTGASLRAGIPTIIRPFFGDQFFWADRVEALGIGAAVRQLTVASLSQALQEVTTDQRVIDRAKLVGEQIRAENGVATAIEAIYRDLEYARTLVKGADPTSQSAGHSSRGHEYFDEHATIRNHPAPPLSPLEQPSPSWSAQDGTVSDWSVISDTEDPPQSL